MNQSICFFNSSLLREGFTNPPLMDFKKNHVCFLGFLAHLEQKIFLNFFHLATHHRHPLDPSFPPTTYAPHCRHPPWWVVAVVDAGGGWHQWWFVVVGGSSGCQRLAVVSGVGWQWWVLQWWGVAIADAGIGCYLNQCLVWPNPPPKMYSTLVKVQIICQFFIKFI